MLTFYRVNDRSGSKATRVGGLAMLLLSCILSLAVLPGELLAQGRGGRSGAGQPEVQREPWMLIQPAQSSLVLAVDGSLIGEIGSEQRTNVLLSTLPKYLPNAFIAVEDQRFRQHNGVDLVGVVGAIKDNILGDSRGASTITQQLVGNMHPDLIDRSQRTIGRKLAEQAAAREMERRYSKDQILEAYLNQISFGHGWYGVEAAARHYFGKGAAQVSLEEAAMLAALPKGPADYDPARFPERAVQRRNLVLELMADQGYVTREEAAAAKAQPLVVAPDRGLSAPAGYFVDAVRAEAERNGIQLSAGGYRVFTTLDPQLQVAAVEALKSGALELESQPDYRHLKMEDRTNSRTNYLQGAVVAIDAQTGNVRALVGGRDHTLAPFNRATTAKRQPGSSFKPFVYAAAVADSISASAFVADSALRVTLPDRTVYSPSNSDGEFLGGMTMREALVKSRNSVAVQLGMGVGMDSVVALAHRAGIQSDIAAVPATAIGASEVSLFELVSAYTAFANMGVSVAPRMIIRVEDSRGRTVWTPSRRPPVLALDPRVAYIVRDMLREAALRGTGAPSRQFVPARVPVAGKTGTTNNNADVWFVGMTPEIVAGVWLGFDSPTGIAPGVFGGTLAAPVWSRMIGRWYEGRAAGEWVVPGGMISAEMDRLTGQPADSLTPDDRRYMEYFLPGTEPDALRPQPLKFFRLGPIGG